MELCKILCAAGAKATTVDKSGFDPIAYSKQCQKEECTNFLLSINHGSRSDQNIREDAKALKGNDDEGEDELGWQKLLDDSTGYFYYHNRNTGESLWEDDYIIYMRSLLKGGLRPIASSFSNRPPPPSSSQRSVNKESKENDDELLDFEDENAQGKEATVIKQFTYSDDKEYIDDGVKKVQETKTMSFSHINPNDLKQMLSDSDTSSQNSSMIDYEEESKGDQKQNNVVDNDDAMANVTRDKLVTKGSFNLRFHSLQTSMEDQLHKTLKTIEQKIMSKTSADLKREESDGFKTTISELTSKLIQLQTEVGSKDFEIKSLKDEMVTMESNSVPKKEFSDVCLGDNDIQENQWVHVQQLDKLTAEICSKENKLQIQQDEIINLQSTLQSQSSELKLLTEKQERGKEQVLQMEELLKGEREAKREVLVLLEQAQQGTKVDAEIAKQLEDEKRRTEDELVRVKMQLHHIEKKIEDKVLMDHSQLEESQRLILSEQTKVKSLQEIIQMKDETHEREKAKLVHEHLVEIEDVRCSLQRKCEENMRIIDKELDEEKLARMQNELERDEAIRAYQGALTKTKTAELELARMSAMIEEAKAMISANEKLYRSLHVEIDRRKALHNQLEDLKGKIRVYVRIRPLSSSEITRNCREVLIKEDKRTCVMYKEDNGEQVKSWEFDSIFHGSSTDGNSQEDVFKDTRKLVTSTIDGFNVCIFAYGQTGSGKTYTMFGYGGLELSSTENFLLNNADVGLAPRVAFELFQLVEERKASFDVKVKMSMFELYNDDLRDLMSQNNDNSKSQSLRIKLAEHSDSGLVEVAGAVTKDVEDAKQLLELFKKGSEFRTTASTKMNADSSRSHLITTITVSLTNKRTDHVINGKMTLVDLAGSERVGKSGATGNQLKEAQSINKSLSALGDVINALTTGSKHIPYRNHPLTMLMSDSMGGSAKTLMFVCCSPADYNSAESSNALDFAKRCKDVRNNVVACGATDLGQVNALKAQLSRLKKENGEMMTKKMGVARRPGRRKY